MMNPAAGFLQAETKICILVVVKVLFAEAARLFPRFHRNEKTGTREKARFGFYASHRAESGELITVDQMISFRDCRKRTTRIRIQMRPEKLRDLRFQNLNIRI